MNPALKLAVGLLPVALFPAILAAQTTSVLNLYPQNPAVEQAELNQAVTEANGSAIDLTRALEQHLRKYPNSPRRAEMEAALYRNAVDANDHARIILYGGKILAGKPDNEQEVLERVIRALLASDDEESARQALLYLQRYDADVKELRSKPPEGHTTLAQWTDLADRAGARASVLRGRAIGNLGNPEEAIADARRAWDALPTAESAHEMARWLAKMGRNAEAIDRYADAAMIDDSRSPWSDRDRDRKLAADLYAKLHNGSDQGLGDVFLKAWDRDTEALRARTARYQAMDRNYGLTSPLDFVLPTGGNTPPNVTHLDMPSLKGKTLVMDFWATWCVPCRAQQPLIENVKKKYTASGDVVFLSLDADDDHSLVAPFLKAQKWDQPVYLEAGLAGLLNVTSLPTVLVIDPTGKVFSRMTGFSADVFERMLSERIDGARSVAAK
jgi:thiol-disulfide isomerase/thioredoxin